MDDVKRKAFFSRISHALGRKEIPTFVAPYPYEKDLKRQCTPTFPTNKL